MFNRELVLGFPGALADQPAKSQGVSAQGSLCFGIFEAKLRDRESLQRGYRTPKRSLLGLCKERWVLGLSLGRRATDTICHSVMRTDFGNARLGATQG